VVDCKDLAIDGLSRVEEAMRMTLNGLAASQLMYRPAESANSIAWLAWHLTRVEDDHISELAGRPQAWVADGWHARFGKPADPQDTGFGYTAEQVAALRIDGPQLLLEYHATVHRRSIEFLQMVSCSDMDRIIDTNWDPPVTMGVRLISVVDDCAQHVGQMAYIRGLIENRHWLPY
jgi:Protein of unknown function (DUF664)